MTSILSKRKGIVDMDQSKSKIPKIDEEDEEDEDDYSGIDDVSEDDISDISDVSDVSDVSDESEEEENKDINYLYHSKIPGQKNICFSEEEKNIIIEYIPESKDNFTENYCDMSEKYQTRSDYHCSRIHNFIKGFTYITETHPNLFKYIKHDEYDISFFTKSMIVRKSNRYLMKYKDDVSNLLKNQEDGTVLFLNARLVFDEGKSTHHISFDIRKNGNKVYIKVIDLACWLRDDKELLKNSFKYIYSKDILNIQDIQDIDINIYFTFDDFIMTEENITTEEELYSICRTEKAQLQYAEKELFGIGYCVGWALYFIVEMYINKIDLNTIYRILYQMNKELRAKYIFVWYDNFFIKL